MDNARHWGERGYSRKATTFADTFLACHYVSSPGGSLILISTKDWKAQRTSEQEKEKKKTHLNMGQKCLFEYESALGVFISGLKQGRSGWRRSVEMREMNHISANASVSASIPCLERGALIS